MAARRASNIWLALLALVMSMLLWFLAHGQTEIERGYDVPVVFQEIPERLVITDQSADVVNVQVQGTRAAHRQFFSTKSEYALALTGGKPGPAVYEVDISRIELPRGARIVSRSPAAIELKFERRGRKSVEIRPDLEGEPAEGYALGEIEVDPPRVWLAGARSAVLRLSEVVTETIDVSGVTEPVEREARLSLGSEHVWMEENQPVTVRVHVEPLVPPEEEVDGEEVVEEQTG